MIAAEHVAELVLVAELHVPVRVPEKSIGPLARPPRFLEVVVQVGVPAHERSRDTGAHCVQLIAIDGAIAGRRDWPNVNILADENAVANHYICGRERVAARTQ